MKSTRSTQSKKKAPIPSTTTPAISSSTTKKRRSAPKEAPPLIPGVSLPALDPPASTTGPTPTATGVLPSSINPIVAASAAALASNATSVQMAATAPGVPTGADDPPAITFPQVPATFTRPSRFLRGVFPNSIELGGMRQAVLDLNSFAGYAALMGSSVEPASSIASTITRALAWRAVRNESEAWADYVKVEDALAWQLTMKFLAELRPSFLLAVSKTPSLATRYPGLTAVFSAGKQIAKKAAATKAKKAKVSAASNAGTASAATAAPAAAVKATTTGS